MANFCKTLEKWRKVRHKTLLLPITQLERTFKLCYNTSCKDKTFTFEVTR